MSIESKLNKSFLILAFMFAVAIPTTETNALTLADLFAGQSIQSGDKIFENWTLDPNFEGSGYYDVDGNFTPINYSNIEVTAVSGTNAHGVKYTVLNDELETVGFFDLFTIAFEFDVRQEDNLAIIIDNELELLSYTNTDGIIIIDENHSELDPNDGPKTVFDEFGQDSVLTDHRVFAAVSQIQNVYNTVTVVDAFGGGIATNLDMWQQTFSQIPPPPDIIPEPATALMGLLGIGVLAMRRGRN